jgi:hypothetical protein
LKETAKMKAQLRDPRGRHDSREFHEQSQNDSLIKCVPHEILIAKAFSSDDR